MPKSPHDDATGYFNIDAFIRDLTTMTPTIIHVMTMDQSELSRLCLKRMREQGGREEIETRGGGALRPGEARALVRERGNGGLAVPYSRAE